MIEEAFLTAEEARDMYLSSPRSEFHRRHITRFIKSVINIIKNDAKDGCLSLELLIDSINFKNLYCLLGQSIVKSSLVYTFESHGYGIHIDDDRKQKEITIKITW